MSRVIDAESRNLKFMAALGLALITTACSPVASQFGVADPGAQPTAAAFPQAIAPPKITPQVAAVLRAPPASAADAQGAQHICLDKTFYGTMETKCAWGEGD